MSLGWVDEGSEYLGHTYTDSSWPLIFLDKTALLWVKLWTSYQRHSLVSIFSFARTAVSFWMMIDEWRQNFCKYRSCPITMWRRGQGFVKRERERKWWQEGEWNNFLLTQSTNMFNIIHVANQSLLRFSLHCIFSRGLIHNNGTSKSLEDLSPLLLSVSLPFK